MQTYTRPLIISLAALAIAGISIAPPARAASLTWSVQDAVFEDGGTLTGSFDYDAETRTYSNVNLAVSGGLLDNFLYQGAPCGVTPTAGRTCLPDRSQSPDQFLIEVFAQSGYTDSAGVKGWLFLGFLQNLTTTGGTVPIFNSGELWYKPQGSDTHRFGQRAIVQGKVVAQTPGTAVPEPMSMVGLALAGAGLACVRRYKSKTASSQSTDSEAS